MIDILFVMFFSASACIIGSIVFVASALLLVITLLALPFKITFFIIAKFWNWLQAPLNY